jgi:hypothetical protein
VVTLTANTAGAAGNFTISSSNAADVAVAGGANGVNGVNGVDYLFLSVYPGTDAGCTANDGCVLSFDVTDPASFTTALNSGGILNVTPPQTTPGLAPTTGIIVDNEVPAGTFAGASQIYFLTQDTAGTAPCTGVCAVQAAQSAP